MFQKKIRYAVRFVCISILLTYYTYIEKFPSDMNVIKVKLAVGNDLLYLEKIHDDRAVTYRFELNVSGGGEAIRDVICASKSAVEENQDILAGGRYALEYDYYPIQGLPHEFLRLANYHGWIASDHFDNLSIYGSWGWIEPGTVSIYDEAQNYTELEGIRYLTVGSRVAQNAAESGIDWYAVWDTLESYEVVE